MSSNRYFLIGLVVAVSAVVFLVDFHAPWAIAAGVPYILSVFIASRVPGSNTMIWTAAACSGLVILGLNYSPQSVEIWQILVNRALALLAIWSAVFFLANRKQAEASLLESEERFRNAFEQSRIPIGLADEAGNLTKFNAAYRDLVGYPEPELMTMDFQSLTHPDDLKIELPLYEKLVAGDIDNYVMEKRYIRKSGDIMWVIVNGTVVRDIQGKPVQFIGQFQNITGRKQAEEELRRFESIASSSGDVMSLLDNDFIYRAVNNTFLETFKNTRDEVIGQSVPELFGQEFFDAVIKPNAQKCLTGKRVQFQEWYDFPARGRRYMDVAYSPYIGEDNRVEGFVVNARDITERRQVLEALQESEQKLRSITNAIPGAVFQFASSRDGEYKFAFMSKGAKQLLEVESSETAEEFAQFLGYVVPEDLPALQESIAVVVRNPTMWSHEFRVRTPDGKVKWLSGKSTPEPRKADGSIVFNGLLLDITEHVRAEEALERTRHLNQQILEAAGEGIYGVDLEGYATFINPAAAQMLGWERGEFVGRLAHSVLHHTKPDDAPYPARQCPIYAAVKDGQVRKITDEVFWRKDGTSFPVDYVSTPILENGEISGAVVVFRDTTEAKRLSEELLYQATHDGLTGLVNRHDFEQQLGHFLSTASKRGTENILAYLDLDQFKVINDTCGHVAGDALLRRLAVILKDQLRKDDTLARLGGDEFGILMSNCSMQEAHEIMNRVCEGIAKFRFVWEGKSFNIGVSIGLVPINGNSMDLSEALKRADAACYAAKDGGRNRLHVYHEDDTELARRHGEMQWVYRINHALEHNDFQLHAQPIVATDNLNDRGAHYELLIRMKNGEEGTIAPGAFLPAAERYNLSPVLDRWVVKTAFEWLSLRPEHLDNLELCCINLSGLSLGDRDTLPYIVKQLSDTRIPAKKICFEITETAAIANLAQASHFINTLKEHGCNFALDDFGSGLSSFAYLKNLPVDFLKIDGIFVKDIVEDPIDFAMVKSINEIGHVMGMKTIGEFVENAAIFKKLKEINVDYAQGFGVGRPQTLEDLLPIAVAV